jgi:hypothetical protein
VVAFSMLRRAVAWTATTPDGSSVLGLAADTNGLLYGLTNSALVFRVNPAPV